MSVRGGIASPRSSTPRWRSPGGNSVAACSTFAALRNEVQTDKKIPEATAAAILAAVAEVEAAAGCNG